LGQRTVLLSLAEPRASQQARWLEQHGFEVLIASTHRLKVLDRRAANWAWADALSADHDVLIPASPGAVGCLASGLEQAGLNGKLAAMAWLCLGEGSLEAIQSHFPILGGEGLKGLPERQLARLEHRDLSHLLADSQSRRWIGNRTVHLLCAKHRVAAIELAFQASWGQQLTVHGVYEDQWSDMPASETQRLLRALASADRLCWQLGSIALLEQVHRALCEESINDPTGGHQTLEVLRRGRAMLHRAAIIAPHKRIIDRAKQLGYEGPASILAGSEALLDWLSMA
jgi:hypothetical protein